MKKLFIALFISALTISGVPAVVADAPPSIAIIDTGMNVPLFKDSIVYEVCLISSGKCPNGKLTMEGPGAANLPTTSNKTFDHGTQMGSG